MKRLFILAFIVGAINAMAQPAAGKKFVGGGLSFRSDKSEQGTGNPDAKLTTLTISPSAGYFISEKFAVGLNLSLSSESDDNGTTVDKTSGWGVGPFAQYYIPIGEGSFRFLAEGGLRYGQSKFKPDGGGDVTSKNVAVYISPGFSYFFTKSWALDFKLQGIVFNSSDPNTDSGAKGDKDSTFIFGASSLNPSLGFRFIF